MEERNLAEVFRQASRRYAQMPRWKQRTATGWKSTTFAENQALVYKLLAGLQTLGVSHGDRIAFVSNTSWQWMISDWATMCLGAVTVTIYPTLLADTTAYIVNDSDSRYIFAENNEQVQKLQAVRSELEGVERVIVFDPTDLPADPWLMSFDALMDLHTGTAEEQAALADECAAAIKSDDLASIVYTSGTTGNPKGAMLSHTSFIAELEGLRSALSNVNPGDSDLLFLPMAHIFGRVQHILGLDRGFSTTISPSVKTVLDDVQAAKPVLFFSVPRIYEKIFSTAKARAEAKPITKRIFNWAINVGRRVSHLRENKKNPSGLLNIQYKLADKLVFHKLRTLLGGNIKYAVTSGAPLDLEILEFFNGAGMTLLECWGLTEVTGAATANSPHDYRLGTVGKPIRGSEVKIAEDGEILIRAPFVMSGYYNSAEKTNESIIDGWFYTGDIGEFDSDGFLKITDRKKDLLVTSAGKNIAPQAVEAAFKNIPYVSQCAVYGDRKPYLVALLTLDPEALQLWADREGVNLNGPAEQNPKVRELIAAEVAAANATLPSFEQIKYYEILPEDFSVENGLLTPTLKLRRRYVYDRYQPTFEDLYKPAS